MTKPTISIIVPIYNMERYLRECLESIKGQTFVDWECILVDDGSIDSSLEICREFAQQDLRFKIIEKENGGLSSARNIALKQAQGEYIGFVDADDWIEPGMFECLFNRIVENDADISMVGYWTEYHGRRSTKHLTKELRVIDGKTAMIEIGYDRLPNYVWNKLHRRSIITCEFPVGRNFEDIFVYGQWLKNVRKMVIDPTPLYHYRMRRSSIIHVDAAKNRYDYFLSCIDRMKMIEDVICDSKDSQRRNAYLNKSAVAASKSIAREETNTMKRDGAIARISNEIRNYPLPSPRFLGLKKWWRARLLRTNPKLFSWLMRAVYSVDIDSKHRKSHLYE